MTADPMTADPATTEPTTTESHRRLRDELAEIDSDTLARAIAVAKLAKDPALPGILFADAVTLFGLVLAAFVWLPMASFAYVAFQLPYVVSGGLAGLSLVAVGVIVASALGRRREQAMVSRSMAGFCDDLASLADVVIARRSEQEVSR
jgi:pilus assembly protein TadC